MLPLKEFLKMKPEQRREEYQNLSDHDKFLFRTQYDIPSVKVTGTQKVSKEEQEKASQWLYEYLKKQKEKGS